jgi:molybdopterin-binding protein
MLHAMTLSARNRLEGKIEELQLGGVMAHVVIRVGDNLIESVITRRSAEEMKLKIGDTVSAVIRSYVGKEIVLGSARLNRCFIPQAHE